MVREALNEYGGLLVLTDVTLPGTPDKERNRRKVAIPWASSGLRRGDPKALHKANRRFKGRLRWIKRKAYNAGRSALLKSGLPFEHLPPVLVGNLELQKRGALHAHLALPYTSPQERVFTRAFIDCMLERRVAQEAVRELLTSSGSRTLRALRKELDETKAIKVTPAELAELVSELLG
ncbi:MAG: hypothetical protein R6W48_09025 [Gaiellaceae bacterium]